MKMHQAFVSGAQAVTCMLAHVRLLRKPQPLANPETGKRQNVSAAEIKAAMSAFVKADKK